MMQQQQMNAYAPPDAPSADQFARKINRSWYSMPFTIRRQRQMLDQLIYDATTPQEPGVPHFRSDRRYQTTQPRNYVDHLVGALRDHSMVIKTEMVPNPHLNEINRLQEVFLRGVLRSADERMMMAARPDVVAALSYYVAMRGNYCGRAMMNTAPVFGQQGQQIGMRPTFEIDVWDPMSAVYEVVDGRLDWIARFDSEWRISGLNVEAVNPAGRAVALYEYIDRHIYCVIEVPLGNHSYADSGMMGARFRVPPTPHGTVDNSGMPACPAFVGMVGAREQHSTQPGSSNEYMFGQVGESALAAVRPHLPKYNTLMEQLQAASDRAARPGMYVAGEMIDKPERLQQPGEVFNFRDHQTRVGYLENIQPAWVNLAAAQLQELRREIQVSTQPDVSTGVGGESQYASGVAISELQRAANYKIEPFKLGLASALEQALGSIKNQFASGRFGPATLFVAGGRGEGNFRENILPQHIAASGGFTVELLPPREIKDPAVMVQAGTLVQNRLMPRERVMSDYLGIEDVAAEKQAIAVDIMEQEDPVMVYATAMKAYARNGMYGEAEMMRERVILTRRKILRDDFLERIFASIQARQGLAVLSMQDPMAAGMLAGELMSKGVLSFGGGQQGGGGGGAPAPALPAGGMAGAANVDNQAMSRQSLGYDRHLSEGRAAENRSNAQQPRGGQQ